MFIELVVSVTEGVVEGRCVGDAGRTCWGGGGGASSAFDSVDVDRDVGLVVDVESESKAKVGAVPWEDLEER